MYVPMEIYTQTYFYDIPQLLNWCSRDMVCHLVPYYALFRFYKLVPSEVSSTSLPVAFPHFVYRRTKELFHMLTNQVDTQLVTWQDVYNWSARFVQSKSQWMTCGHPDHARAVLLINTFNRSYFYNETVWKCSVMYYLTYNNRSTVDTMF